jgi:hypothetical protein
MRSTLWLNLTNWLGDLVFKVRRPALMALKRHRCELCRFRRMSFKAYGFLSPHCPRLKQLYGPLKEGRLGEGGWVRFPFRRCGSVRYLCDKCRRRYDEARAAELVDIEKYAAWAREAPLIHELPDPLIGEYEDNSVTPGRRFVELVDVDYVAEALARASRGWGSALQLVGRRHKTKFRLPRTYRDVVRKQTAPRGRGSHELIHWEGSDYLSSDIDFIQWAGSIYRWHDGRIVLHWTPSPTYGRSPTFSTEYRGATEDWLRLAK